jgi:hypothetical protein
MNVSDCFLLLRNKPNVRPAPGALPALALLRVSGALWVDVQAARGRTSPAIASPPFIRAFMRSCMAYKFIHNSRQAYSRLCR